MPTSQLDAIYAKLQQNGVKLTDQRKEMIETFCELHRPVSAEELFFLLKKKNVGTCLATIYRNLEVLVNQEIVRQMQLVSQKREYELVGEEHYHYLVCLGCNKTVRLEGCPLRHYEAKVVADTNFTITEHRLSLYGYCPQCKPQD